MKRKLIVAATLLFAVHAAVPGLARSTETVDHVFVGISDLQDGIDGTARRPREEA